MKNFNKIIEVSNIGLNMVKKLSFICLIFLFNGNVFSQNITNTLIPTGYFSVKDATSTFLMLPQSTGNVAIDTNSFDVTNPEKLLINCGTTTSVNAIYAKGIINNYFQFNIRNLSTETQSSSDIVCTANNGTETTNFMDMGINGSNYVYQSGNPIETGQANDCYILGAGNHLYLLNNNASKDMIFLTGGTASSNERMRIKYDGKIGIGTTNPISLFSAGINSEFQINSTGNIVKLNNITTSFPSTQGILGSFLINDGTGNLSWSLIPGVIPTLTTRSVIFCGTNGAYIAQDNANLNWYYTLKRLAIGSTTFDATNPEKLKINAGTTTSKNLISAYGSINSYLQLNIKNLSNGEYASSDIVATNNVGDENKGYIDFGINSSGYNDPAYNIGGSNDSYIYCVGNTGGTPVGGNLSIGTVSENTVIKFHTGGSTSDKEKMRINGNGNVGIGTTDPGSYKLYVNGNGYISGTWTESSDIRLKDNVESLQDVLTKIMSLNGYSFKYINDNTGKVQIGFIAQELEKVFPEFITTDANGYKGIAYANVTAVLLEGLKERQIIIESQRKEIEQLNSDVQELKPRVANYYQGAGFISDNPDVIVWVIFSALLFSVVMIVIKKYI
jgi:hypothetical protein